MKIRSGPFHYKYQIKALKRIFKELILGKINWTDLHKIYSAMVHLECYLEKLKAF